MSNLSSSLRKAIVRASDLIAKSYQKNVKKELIQTGLRYEDLINEDIREVNEALAYASSDKLQGRNRRIKRAMHLSFKRKNYVDYVPSYKGEDCFQWDVYGDVEKIIARDQERVTLNQHLI